MRTLIRKKAVVNRMKLASIMQLSRLQKSQKMDNLIIEIVMGDIVEIWW